MDTDSYTIFVIQLKNGIRYLYAKSHNIENISIRDLFLEFRYFVNTFDDNYQPTQILRTYNNVLSYNINSLVIYYMHIYGIEHVRGGKYGQKHLSDEDKEEISTHIKFFANDLFEQEQKIEKYHKYTQEYNRLTIGELWTERSRLDKALLSYHKYNNLYEKLNIVETDDLNKIAWLKQLCENPTNNTVSEIDYELFMSRIRYIFVSFNTYYENADEKIESLRKRFSTTEDPLIWLYNPSAFFNKLVFENSNRDNCAIHLPLIISIIEMIFYSMRNKCNELAFDMNLQERAENMERNIIITNILKPLENIIV